MAKGLAEQLLLCLSCGTAVVSVCAVAMGSRPSVVLVAGFAGALAAIALTLVVARAAGGQGDARIVLMAGVVVAAFANAAINVALADAQDHVGRRAPRRAIGPARDASWCQDRLAAMVLVVGIFVLLALA